MSKRRRKVSEPRRSSVVASAAKVSQSGRALVRFAVLFAALGALALFVLSPALSGPFVSDDLHYMSNNPYVTGFSLDVLDDVLDPRGEPVAITENYTPVHLLLLAASWRLFGPDVAGHHVVNILLHALASSLLVPLYLRSGVPLPAALGGSLLFLLHPANVEAVAWINQVKSTASLSFAILALLALERRPALGSLCFVLALLSKPTSAFALPVAAVFTWARLRGVAAKRIFFWLGLWTALFVAYAAVEMVAFTRAVSGVAPIHPDPFVQLRTSVGFVARYFTMATTSLGVSAFHQPPAALSPADAWWLGGLALLGVFGARAVVALRARREEAAYWIWAATAFLPVAQVWPFPFPLADRYLYPILPGLIGAVVLWGLPFAERGLTRRSSLAPVAAVLALGVLALFGARSHARARLWAIPALLVADSARHYPDGVPAQLRRATRAAQMGDSAAATEALRAALGRGYDRFDQVLADPNYAALRGHPAFDALIADMAGRWISRLGPQHDLAQSELLSLAIAHRLRGEREEARRAALRGLSLEGPLREALELELRLVGGG